MSNACFARFKKPRKDKDESCSTTEEEMHEDQAALEEPGIDHLWLEQVYIGETQQWLDTNAAALFNLQVSRWLAKQKKADQGLKIARK